MKRNTVVSSSWRMTRNQVDFRITTPNPKRPGKPSLRCVMGTVYQAEHQRWGIDLAVKVIKARLSSDLSFVAQFEREAETWANIGLHPYVATCHYTQGIGGALCVFAEFVEGGSLQYQIRDRSLYQTEDAAVVSTILHISAGMALGLDWAHRHGLVHQDVKPGNVLLTPDGSPKVADFGLARSLQPDGRALASGCTPAYASPEQLSGGSVSAATDVWSWAASVLHMFMGDVRWESGLAAPAALSDYCSRHRRIPGLPQMPQGVAGLLASCFRGDPSVRPQNCLLLAQSVSEIHEQLFGEPIEFAEYGTPELAADSLNNRAVSLIEARRFGEAQAILGGLVSSKPDHVEGNFNLLLMLVGNGQMDWAQMRARLASLGASRSDDLVAELARSVESALRNRIKAPPEVLKCQSLADSFPFALVRPRSGAEHHYESERFHRLVTKAAGALETGNAHEARRYLRMSMDIEGFSSHPKLRELVAILGS